MNPPYWRPHFGPIFMLLLLGGLLTGPDAFAQADLPDPFEASPAAAPRNVDHLSIPDQLSLLPDRPLMLDAAVGGNPADGSAQESEKASRPTAAAQPPFTPARSWEMPAIVVSGKRASELREEDRIGAYGQPRWSADRRFGETRVYVIPERKVEFEYWLVANVPHHGPTEIKHMFELEFGLPSRFQFDLYVIDRHEGSGGHAFIDGQFELRYALADWNVIWGNPTLYVEYKSIDRDPDEIETKLLLGGEIAPRWHWGLNAVWDGQTGGERIVSYELAGGVSYTVKDELLSVGAETHLELLDRHGHRGNYRSELFVGPSIQFRPLPNMHLDFAPLIGALQDGAFEGFFIFGYEF